MKIAIAIGSVALVAAPMAAAPRLAVAQPYYSYGTGDPCWAAKRRAGNQGALEGGVLGAVLGGAVAGRGSQLGGAVVGGTVGAVAGHEIGRNSVRCVAYPRRFRPRPHCHWVEQDHGGRPHQFELCRDRNGVWRPSGRRG